jgi:hypothetical protein
MLLPDEKIDHSVSILLYPIKPAAFFSYFGMGYGMVAYYFPKPKQAALFGVLFLSFPPFLISVLLLIKAHVNPINILMVYFFIIITSMGAIVGGLTSIIRVSIFTPSWPRFTLRELLVGFFLLAVIFGCLTALSHELIPTL